MVPNTVKHWRWKIQILNSEYQTILDAGKITDILEPNRGFSEYDTNSLLSLCV
jgi:hypothetical protein